MNKEIEIYDKNNVVHKFNLNQNNYKAKWFNLLKNYNFYGLMNSKNEVLLMDDFYFEFFKNKSIYYIIENIKKNEINHSFENLFDKIEEIESIDDFWNEETKSIKIVFCLNYKITIFISDYILYFLQIIDIAYKIHNEDEICKLDTIKIYYNKNKYTEVFFEKDENYLNKIFRKIIKNFNHSSLKSISTNLSIYKNNNNNENIDKNKLMEILKFKIRYLVKIDKLIYYFILLDKFYFVIFKDFKNLNEKIIIESFDNFEYDNKNEIFNFNDLIKIIEFLIDIGFLDKDSDFNSTLNETNKNKIVKELNLFFNSEENEFIDLLLKNEFQNTSFHKSQLSINLNRNYLDDRQSNFKNNLFTLKKIESQYFDNGKLGSFLKKRSEEDIKEYSINVLGRISSFNNKDNFSIKSSIKNLNFIQSQKDFLNFINNFKLNDYLSNNQLVLFKYFENKNENLNMNLFYNLIDNNDLNIKLINKINDFIKSELNKSLSYEKDNILEIIEESSLNNHFIEFYNTNNYNKLIKKIKKFIYKKNDINSNLLLDESNLDNNFSNVIKQYNDTNINQQRILIGNKIIYNIFKNGNYINLKEFKKKRNNNKFNKIIEIKNEDEMIELIKIINNNIIYNIKKSIKKELNSDTIINYIKEYNFEDDYDKIKNKLKNENYNNIILLYKDLLNFKLNSKNINESVYFNEIFLENEENSDISKNKIILEKIVEVILFFTNYYDNYNFFNDEKKNYFIKQIFKFDLIIISVFDLYCYNGDYKDLIENLFLIFQFDYINKNCNINNFNISDIQNILIERLIIDSSLKKKLYFLNKLGFEDIYYSFFKFEKFRNITYFINNLKNFNPYKQIMEEIKNKCNKLLEKSNILFINKNYIKNLLFNKNKFFYKLIYKNIKNNSKILKLMINFSFDKWVLENKVEINEIHKKNLITYLNSKNMNENEFNKFIINIKENIKK